MQAKVISDEHSYRREIEIEISSEEMQPIVADEKKKLKRRAQIPGFRKGKAPEFLIEKHYGGTLIQDIIDRAVNDFYPKALDEVKLKPVSQGEIKDLQYENIGDSLAFKVYVEVEPEVKVKDYKKKKFEKSVRTFREEDIEDFLNDLRERNAVAQSIDGPVEDGDIVVLDMEELDEEGKPIAGKTYNDIRIQIGKGQFDKDLESELIGMNVEQTKVLSKTYPEDFEDKALAGKTESFQTKVKRIERLIYPEINDDFVKDMGEYNNLEQYKKKLKELFIEQNKKDAENSLRHDIIHKLVEDNPFELPDSMIERELDVLYHRAASYGEKVDEKVFRQYYRQAAEENVRWNLIKKVIAEKEKMEITDDDVRQYLKEEGWPEKQIESDISNPYLREQVEEELLQRKVMAHITDVATVTEKDITPKKEKKTAKKKKPAAKKEVKDSKAKKSGPKTTAAKKKTAGKKKE
jgi:trigger factor